MYLTLKGHIVDNMEDENSVLSHGYQISSSKESVRVGNITLLQVKNVPNQKLIVDPKKSSDNDHNSNDNTIDITHVLNKSCTISPDSCEDKSHDESEKSIPKGESEENIYQQTSPVTTYMASTEDTKIIAAACYNYVIDMLENCDSLPIYEDNQSYEDKILCYLDPFTESTEKASDLQTAGEAQHANNDEDMQCVAMACYEAVIDMLRNGDIQSVDDFNSKDHIGDDKPVYYLDVERSNNYELPLYTYPSSVSVSGTQRHPHHEEKTTLKVISLNSKSGSQQTHSQPLVTTEDTTMQHHDVNTGSVDSLMQCNEQTNSDHQVEEVDKNGKTTTTLKADDYGSKKSMTEEPSSNDLCKYTCILLQLRNFLCRSE